MLKAKRAILLLLFVVFSGSVARGSSVASTTVLTISPGSSVAAGTAVTLSAAVMANSAPVTQGQVLFCVATATYCTDSNLIGTAQLTEAGSASLKMTLGAGTYSIIAKFLGVPGTNPSTSSARPLTVTSNINYFSYTTLTPSGSTGDYTLTATVLGGGRNRPTGTVNFVDQTDSNAIVATAPLNAASLFYGFISPVPQLLPGGYPQGAVAGDFNGDGIADLAVVSQENDTISVFLGVGNGTFQSPVIYNVGEAPMKIVAGDFNGDGALDLAVTNYDDGTVGILLNNGNGTFANMVPYAVDGFPNGLVVGDFNNDGLLDIAVTVDPDSDVVILRGMGAGSFCLTDEWYAVGNEGSAIAAADFNHDGKLDVAVVNDEDNTVSILLGNGDLTFQTQSILTTGSSPYGIAVGDFNEDGNPDIAVANSGNGTISIFAGNGAGGFTPLPPVLLDASIYGIATADFNQDGHLDLVLTNLGGNNAQVFLGNGAGGFSYSALYNTGYLSFNEVVADWNGDGLPDFAVVNAGDDDGPNSVSIFLGEQTETATATNVSVTGAGSHTVAAEYPGDADRMPSASTGATLQGVVATATALTGAPNPSTYGQSVTLTATVTPAPTGEILGTVSFYNGEVLISSANVNSSGIAALITTSLPVGTLTLTATYNGSSDGYATSTSTGLSFVVSQVTTATVLALSPNPVVAGASETLTATVTPAPTGGALGAVTFYNGATLVGTGGVNSSGVATATSTTLPAGVLSLTAVYSGNTDFTGSTSPAQSLTVLVATATVLTGSPNPSIYGQSVTLTATVTPAPSGSPLGTITFMNGSTQIGSGNINASGVATLTTSSLAVSTYSLTAVYSGNAAFNASTSLALSLVVNLAPTATVVTASPSPAAFGQSVTLTATIAPAPTGGSLGVVSFFNGGTAVGSGPVNSSGVATITTAVLPVGSLSLTGVYGGNAGFAGSTSIVDTLVVNALPTATALALSPNPVVTGQTETLTATITPTPAGTPFGTVNFFNGATQIGSGNVNASGVATMTTSSLAAGTPSLTAAYSGTTDYVASTSTAQNLTVLAATATVLNASPNPSTYGQSVTFTATVTPAPTGSSLGTVSFLSGSTQLGTANINSSGVATLTTNSLTVAAYSLTAIYSGNAGFNTSTSSALSFTVNLAPTTTVLTSSPSPATYGQSVTLTATVTPAPTGTTLGTVTFFNGETQLGTGTVSSGTATFTSTSLPAGALSLTAVYSGNTNFAGSTATALSLTVNTTYTVTVPPTTYDVAQGGSVSINVVVPPIGGAYNSVVTLSASGLPPGATATFVPPTVTPGTTGAPTTLTIQLAPLASHLIKPVAGGPRMQWLAALFNPAYGSALAALLATLMLVALPRRKRMAKALQLAAFIAVACLVGSALTGCSGGFLRPPSTQPGSFTVTITGTSGSVHQSATVTVVVQ